MLRPLLLDVVPSIQQTAALALGRLADHSDDLAQAVVKEDILPQLVHSLTFQNVSIAHLFCSNRAKCFKMFQRWFDWWICMCVCVCLRERERGRRPCRPLGSAPWMVEWVLGYLAARLGATSKPKRPFYHESNRAFVFSLSVSQLFQGRQTRFSCCCR